jgi:flagellar protein FlaJ
MTQNRIASKKVKIDNSLPFVLAYMATLSSAGMNPVEVIKHVGLKDFGPTSTEFRKIVYRFDVLGQDIIAAINYIALNTPSQQLHDMLIGISNIIISGGSMKAYCEQESKNLFDQRKNKLKQFIDSLAAYSEGYLGGVTVSVIMGLVAIILLGTLGIQLIPNFGTQDLMLVFVFFAIPFINIVFLGLLELKFSGDTT